MNAQAGKNILLRIGDGGDPQAFQAVAGLRLKTISLNAQNIDATHADSPGGWRELLAGAGMRSCSVSGAGVFVDSQADALIRTCFFEQRVCDWQIVIPDFGQIDAPCLVSTLEYIGRHDGEASWSMALSSAGSLTFLAL